MPVFEKSRRTDGTFSRSDFTYDHDGDVYLCPGGKMLTTKGTVVNDDQVLYRASKHDCSACAPKARCCPKEPVRKFKVFTEDFGRFKPREHNLLRVEIAETVFERRVGGHLYDRGVDVFSWDISPQWRLETDLKKKSEVEVRFVAETPRRTRVELEHRHLERHGPGWEGVREGVGGADGWPRYLRAYAELFATG